MRLKCPACGALASLDILLTHDGARDAVMLALQFPAPLGKRLIQYLTLFRPATRELSFDRVASILGEILPDVQSAKIKRGGRELVMPLDYWQMGIDAVIAARDAGRLTLPMKSHGYLYEILAGMVDKAEAKRETEHEKNRATGGDVIPAGMVVINNPQQQPQAPPPDKSTGRQHLAGLKTQMGIRPGGNESE